MVGAPAWLAVVALLAGCAAPLRETQEPPAPPSELRGVDASSLARVLAHGGVFRQGNDALPPLEIYRRHGVDTIRLRLFVDPASGENGLAQVIAEARRARDLGFRLFLDLHYSDTWADPGHQAKPRAWEELSGPQLEERVETYTRDVLLAFRDAGAMPQFVQVGNEITNGFLWPDGRLNATPTDNWPGFARLLARACAAVRAVDPAPARPDTVPAPGIAAGARIVLHLDSGGDNAACRAFLDRAAAARLDYDVIGLSYYPWWHGDLAALEANLTDLAERYKRPIVLCETAYPWTLAWADSEHNIVGQPGQLLPGLPATPDGQRRFIEAVRGILSRVPRGRALGCIYWSADWIAAPGAGSPWDNVTLFDFDGRMLPGLEALGAPPAVRGAADSVPGSGP